MACTNSETFPSTESLIEDAAAAETEPTVVEDEDMTNPTSLKDRLGTRVYLYTDVATSHKRSRDEVDDGADDEDGASVLPDGTRPNAIYITGTPISFLKTQSIFAYASHFDSTPTALEWINDISVVFVYPTNVKAKQAFRFLRKSIAEEEDMEGFLTAKPIPVDLWPLETRIQLGLNSQTDERNLGIKARLQLRYARTDDTKQKGSRQASEFYKKYGERAGKEMYEPPQSQSRKRRRGDNGTDIADLKKSDLDAELDGIRRDSPEEAQEAAPHRKGRREEGRRNHRARKTLQELDDELDSFLKDGG